MKAILVIREPDIFSTRLIENNYPVINLPTIKTQPLNDLSELEKVFEKIEIYDGIFLTSRHAAQVFAEKFGKQNAKYSGKVYVLGQRSFDILQKQKINLVFDEKVNTAHQMLDKISPENIRNKKFLFICGKKSLRVVPEYLKKFASAIDEITIYETLNLKVEKARIKTIREKLESDEIAAACFFSPSGAESFLEQFGAASLHQTFIATIGDTTAEFFEQRSLSVGFISPKASAEDFAVELISFLEKKLVANKHEVLRKV